MFTICQSQLRTLFIKSLDVTGHSRKVTKSTWPNKNLRGTVTFFPFWYQLKYRYFDICTPMQTLKHTKALSLLFSNALAHFPRTPGEHFHSSAPRRTATIPSAESLLAMPAHALQKHCLHWSLYVHKLTANNTSPLILP